MTATAPKPEPAALGFSQEDWDEVSDNPELTDDQLAALRPVSEMPDHLRARLPKRGRGRPKAENAKVNVTLRLDPAILEAYKAGGPGWQVRMGTALAEGVERPAEAERIDRPAGTEAKDSAAAEGQGEVIVSGRLDTGQFIEVRVHGGKREGKASQVTGGRSSGADKPRRKSMPRRTA
jgi:uncharacterized protein (DUF4415 family)